MRLLLCLGWLKYILMRLYNLKNGCIVACIVSLLACTNKESTVLDITSPSAMCAPVITDTKWYETDQVAPLFTGLDVLHFTITTKSELAQKYFNQGMVLAYGFNHAEAARSFYYATKLDPSCAMAYWGYAYVLGPNYNAGMEPDNYIRAYEAVQKAVQLGNQSSAKERDLILALSARYVQDPIENRSALDIAYAEAMHILSEKYIEDADVATLYAESIMDLHPWDLWDENGVGKKWTKIIEENLNHALQLDPKHVGAHHFYIHLVEASPRPEKGLESAKLFDEGLAPGAGHLLHMPSHIYIRTGDYHNGTLSNLRAVEVDSLYVSSCHAQGAYPLAYFPHNFHFMAATATLAGDSRNALMAADKVAAHANRQLMKEPGWGTIQHYYTIPYYVKIKFGKWEEILEMSNDDTFLKYPKAVRHYARGMAFLGLKKNKDANNELVALKEIAIDEELKEITIWDINSVYDLMQIGIRVLEGEILASTDEFKKGIALLEEARDIEDHLNYNEPPDWFFSVRHHLGAVQVEAEMYEEAIITYQQDLVRLPKNGWALHGLKLVYSKMNDEKNENIVDKQLSKAWTQADITLENSRY